MARGELDERAAFADDGPPASSAAATAPAAPITARLRIEWGGGTAQAYSGAVYVEGGRVADPAPLGLEIDEPGSMHLFDGRLTIEPRGPRTYDGVDLTVTAPRDAQLIVFLPTPGADAQRHPDGIKIPLADVLGKTYHTPLEDSGGNRLSVRRAPGDRLQVSLKRDNVLFTPGELCELEIRPHLLGLAPAAAVRLSASLVAARQTKALWSDGTDLTAPAPSSDGNWESIPLSIRLPDEEGVYDIVLELGEHKLANRLHLSSPAERRKVQIVVLSPQPPGRGSHQETPPPSLLEEIDPASHGWWDRLKTAALPSGMRRGPLGNCRVSARRTPAGMFLELPPSAEAASGATRDLSWQAYPLAVARPGVPHYLEIEYPSDIAQSLGVSLVEPNAAGAVLPLGVDQGFFIDEPDVEKTPRRLTRRFIIWPRTAAPLVVVMNRRSDAPAVYGKLRLLGPKAPPLGQLVPMPWGASDPTSLPHAHLPEARADGRLLAAYYDRPLFPENFSNSAGLDDAAGEQARCLDDWVTFYDGARRLVEYLTHAGYNGAMITVAADGSAIYPSRLLEPTPRYDDGVFFASGQDPLRKDVLELLLRMFDREGLRLVPALQLTARLPRLEAERRRALAAKSPDPVAPLRTTFRTPDAAQPLYDPLKPRVEQELAAVLAELNERYGRHPSLSGLAVHLSADGFTQLPGLDWGADFAALRTFAQQAQLALPQNLSERELASRVVDEHRAAWLNWRAEALTQVYRRLQPVAAGGNASRRLYLIAAHSWDRPELEARLQPALPQTAAAEQTLLESGVDPARLGKLPGVVWMRPYRSGPTESLVRRGATLEIQRADALDAAAQAQTFPAGLVFHEPLSARLESFEKQSPFQPTYGRVVAQSTAVGAAGRRPLAHQLATLDSLAVVQGGWTLPLGQEDDLRKFAGVVRALPAEKFVTVRDTPSYLAVRTLSSDDRTYLYVVNDAPWPTTVTLEVAAADDCPWRAFNGSAAQTGWLGAGSARRWQAQLEPYDVVGGVFLEPKVSVGKPQIGVEPEVAQALGDRIKQLWAGATELQRAARSVPLVNPGFELEPAADSAGAGWALVGDDGGRRVESERPHDGARACLLYGVAQGAVLESEPLKIGAAGRVALSVWLRAGNTQPAPLRLALAGVPANPAHAGFYRYATVGGDAETPLGAEWRQFVFQVHDLPMQGVTGVRIRFELTGPGEIVLDDVRLVDLDFTEAERLQLSKMITLAEYKLERHELGECAKLLDGYWPRFLATYVPAPAGGVMTAARDTPRPATNPRPAPPPAPETPAGMRDRLRRFLPEFLR